MADPIPAADPALLAAQAKAGQAGVDAYKAAQAQLTAQRQAAVQQAMQEAAMRGAPAAAVPSIQSSITAPYDQRIASLEQGGAAFNADMAARDRRLADYNAAVGAARSYIPQQADLVAAPIRAEGEFRVKGIEMEGQQKVAGIEAELRLLLAKMEAAALAAANKGGGGGGGGRGGGGGGGGKPEKLNKTELESELSSRAAARLGNAAAVTQANISGNVKRVKQAVKQVAQAVRQGPAGIDARINNKQVAANQAASYILKGIRAAEGKPVSGVDRGGKMVPVMPVKAPPVVTPPSTLGTATRPGQLPVINFPNPFNQSKPKISTQVSPGLLAAGRAAANAPQIASARNTLKNLTRETNDYSGRLMMDYARQIANAQSNAERPLSSFDPESGRRILLSPEQFSMYEAPDQASILDAVRGGGPLVSGTDVARYMGGAPGARGISDPTSSRVMENAMVQALAEMRAEGFEITDSEAKNAMGYAEGRKVGESLYDFQARMNNQPTGQEEFGIAQDIESERRRDDAYWRQQEKQEGGLTEDQAKADEEAARRFLTSTVGYVPPASYGNPIDIVNRMSQPEYDEARSALQDIVDAREGQEYDNQDLDEALADMGISAPFRRLVLQMEMQ